jgi:hypothetical protein
VGAIPLLKRRPRDCRRALTKGHTRGLGSGVVKVSLLAEVIEDGEDLGQPVMSARIA